MKYYSSVMNDYTLEQTDIEYIYRVIRIINDKAVVSIIVDK